MGYEPFFKSQDLKTNRLLLSWSQNLIHCHRSSCAGPAWMVSCRRPWRGERCCLPWTCAALRWEPESDPPKTRPSLHSAGRGKHRGLPFSSDQKNKKPGGAVERASGQISKRTLSLQPRGDDTATTLMAGYMAFRAERCDMQAFTLRLSVTHTFAYTHTHLCTYTPQGLPLITADLCTFKLWNDSKAELRTTHRTSLHHSVLFFRRHCQTLRPRLKKLCVCVGVCGQKSQ